MDDREYNAMPGIRRSDLWAMNTSPMHFKYRIESEPEQTPALIFGQAMHKFVLEPESMGEEFAIIPNVDRRTKAGKEEFDAFRKENDSKTWITEDQFDQIVQMRRVLDTNKTVAEILTGNIRVETPFSWIDGETGEQCKVKADIIAYIDGKPTVIDYKTTVSCADRAFERDARRYGYHFQAGMYCEGIDLCTLEEHEFMFIAQEKTPPYAVRVYRCDRGFINSGRRRFHTLLRMYHECRMNDDWYGYPEETLYEESYD